MGSFKPSLVLFYLAAIFQRWSPFQLPIFASTFWNIKNVNNSDCFGFATGQIADCDIGLSTCPSLDASILTG